MTNGDWADYSKHNQMLEEQYWEEDGQLPDVIDNIISFRAAGSNSSESSKDTSSCDNDSDSDPTDTPELAQLLADKKYCEESHFFRLDSSIKFMLRCISLCVTA
jgi:hypothetical protein